MSTRSHSSSGERAGSKGAVRIATIVWLIGLAVAGVTGCATPILPEPSCACSAEFEAVLLPTDDRPGSTIRGWQFFLGGKRRTEFVDEASGITMIWIDRPDLWVTWLLDTNALTFEERAWRGLGRAPTPFPDPLGGAGGGELEWLASETVNGIEAEKYALRSASASGMAWFTIDWIPVRFEGTAERPEGAREMRVDYTKIRRGPQEAWLFGVPRYYAGWEDRRRPTERSSRGPLDISHHVERLREEAGGRGQVP